MVILLNPSLKTGISVSAPQLGAFYIDVPWVKVPPLVYVQILTDYLDIKREYLNISKYV